MRKSTIEFGDFQTPASLASQVCNVVARGQFSPRTVIEPTCGVGNFVWPVLENFETSEKVLAFDINAEYVGRLRSAIRSHSPEGKVDVQVRDFFQTDWKSLFDAVKPPILVIGNPPWVTNSQLGVLQGTNLPRKTNFQMHRGFDAKTGKSNFDISEWMLIELLEALKGRAATLAMLCKSSVARKALLHAWKAGISVSKSSIHRFDAAKCFSVAADACLLVCRLCKGSSSATCDVYEDLVDEKPSREFGYRAGRLIADIAAFDRHSQMMGNGGIRWRSGVKHDCSRVMELRKEDAGRYRNGFGDVVELESTFLYPMLKSSDLARGRADSPSRWMIIPQKSVGDDTAVLERQAPKTWAYLTKYSEALDRRASSIYRNRPRFSIFGVGEYTFAPWKVGISGLYKKLEFVKIGPWGKKPVVLDDTSYFLSCADEQEADNVCRWLNSELGKEFYSAFIFWDSKRPITAEVLNLLNVKVLEQEWAVHSKSRG